MTVQPNIITWRVFDDNGVVTTVNVSVMACIQTFLSAVMKN
jgi:hypothetical protein